MGTACFALTDFSNLSDGDGDGGASSSSGSASGGEHDGATLSGGDGAPSEGGASTSSSSGGALDASTPGPNLLGSQLTVEGCTPWNGWGDASQTKGALGHTDSASCQMCVDSGGSLGMYITADFDTLPGEQYQGELWVRLAPGSAAKGRAGLAVVNEFANGGNEPYDTVFAPTVDTSWVRLSASLLTKVKGVGVTLGFEVESGAGVCFLLDDPVVYRAN